MKSYLRLLLLCFLALWGAGETPVGAAAPYGWVRSDGRPLVWNTSQPIPYSIDQGPLGRLSNADGAALFQAAVQRWDDVDTAAVNFAAAPALSEDITGANVMSFLNNLAPGVNPVIFDNDGSVMKTLLGDSSAAVALGRPLTGDAASGTITSGFVVLNGLFIDGRFNPDDLSLADYRGMVVQEVGRFLGLGYSQLNADLILDGIRDNNRLVPQMYPQPVPGNGDQLTVDDRAAITALYPAPTFAATTGTLRGQVLLPDGVTGLQGINVVARRVGDPTITAVSAISGMRFKNEIGPPGLDGSRQVALRGAYELVGLPPGAYTLSIEALRPESQAGPLRHPAFLPGGTQYYRFGAVVSPDPNAASQLTLAAGQVVENVNLVLPGAAGPLPQTVSEREPNQFPEQAQTLTLPVRIQGSIQPSDPNGVNVPLAGGATAPVQDLYRITLTQPTVLTVTLSAAAPDADLNLFLLSGPIATAPRLVAASTDSGTPPETFQLRVPAGAFFLGVGSAAGSGSAYTLDVTGTAAPDPTTPVPPRPRLNNLVVVNVTPTGATTRFFTDLPSNTVVYVSNPLTEFSNNTITTDHLQPISDLTPGTAYRLRALAVTPALAVGSLPDFFFTTSLPALAGGVGQISAGIADYVDDPDDPNAVYVVLSFRNVGTGDASGVTITSLNAPPGWAFSNPLPTPLGLGFLGRGGSGIIMTRLVQTSPTAGDDPTILSHLAPAVTGTGTYFSPGVGQQPFAIGGPVSFLTLQKVADPASPRPGDLVTFSLTAANNGQGPATGVAISDTVPAGMAFFDASAGGQFQNGAVVWGLGTLAPNNSATVSFRALVLGNVPSGSTLTNVALIRSNEITSPLASNVVPISVTAPPPPPPPALQLSKTANVVSARPGDSIFFTLTFANTGGSAATNVVLTDTLPVGQILLDAGGGSPSGATVTWNLGTLAPGASGSRSLRLQVAGGTPGGASITNTAQIAATEVVTPVSSSATVQVAGQPLLQINKTASADSARVGDVVTYTLTVANSGTAPATNVQVFDQVPPNTTFLDSPSGSVQSGTVVWNLGTLGAGTSTTVSFRAQLQAGAAGQGSINNIAQVRSAELPNGLASNNVVVGVIAPPQLQLSKVADRSTARPGEVIAFTLTASNLGPGTATNVQIFDAIPNGTSFSSASSGGGFVNGNTIGWNVGTLTPGASASVVLRVQVAGNFPNGSSVSNLGQIRSSELPNLAPSNGGNPVSVVVQSPPQLSVTKQADRSTAAPGDTITYTLTFSNAGPGTATSAQLSDDVPAGTSFVDAVGGSFTGAGAIWNLGTLPAGASGSRTFRVRVLNSTPSGTQIVNAAQIASAEAQTPVPSNSVTVTVSTPSVPQLQLQKSVNTASAQPNDVLTYTISFFNSGSGPATNLNLQDTLPPNTTFVSASSGGQAFGSTVFWSFNSLQPNQQANVTLQVRINPNTPANTQLSNIAQISSAENGTPVPSNAAITTVVVPAQPPVLAVSKQADVSSAAPGGLINYLLTVTNNGGSTATNVVLADQIPAGTTAVIALDGGFIQFGAAQWNLGSLAPNAARQVRLRVQVNGNATGTISNTAQARSAETPTPVNSNAALVTVNVPLNLSIQKVVDKATAAAGDELRYDIGFKNNGTTTVSGATITDTIPAGTQFLLSSQGVQPSGGVLTWNLPPLPPGQAASVTFHVRILNSVPDGTQISNQAAINVGAQQYSQNSNVVTTTVNVPLNLAIQKSVDQPTAGPGDTVRYVIAFKNNGGSTISGAAIRDQIPAGTQFLVASQGVTPVNGVLTWNVQPLAAGQSDSVAFQVRIDPQAANGTQISNQAAITVAARGFSLNSNTVTTTVNVPGVNLKLDKQVDKQSAPAGDTLTYTLRYTNGGPQTFSQLQIVDPLPANTTFVDAGSGGQQVGGSVQFQLPPVGPNGTGTVSFRVQINNGVPGGTIITNQGRIGGPEVPQAVLSNSVNTAVAAAVAPLTLNKGVDKQSAAAGEVVTYSLAYSNPSVQSYSQVAIVDPLPAGTTFVGADSGGQVVQGSVRFNLPPLGPSSNGRVSFQVRINNDVPPGTQINNQGRIGSPQIAQPTLSNTVTTTVAGAQPSGLTLDKQVDKQSAAAGEILTYTLTYTNGGTQPLNQLRITDLIPVNTTFVDAANNGQFSQGSLRFQLPLVGPNESGSVSFRVKINNDTAGGTQITNQAQISGTALPQPVQSNVATTVVGQATPSLAGTWFLVPPADNAAALTVDPAGKFTVWAVSRDRVTVARAGQGTLNADGTFSVLSADRLVRITGKVAADGQSATITAQRIGSAPFSVTAPRAPDLSQPPLPSNLVGTWNGFGQAANGDRLQIRLSIDPGGNSTLVADLVQAGTAGGRSQFANFLVTPDGRLTNPDGNREVGLLQVQGNQLVLTYNFQATTPTPYQNTFQVPLTPLP